MADLSKVDDVFAALAAFLKVGGFKRGKKKGKKLEDAFLKAADYDPKAAPKVVRSMVVPFLNGDLGEPYLYAPSGSVRWRTPVAGPEEEAEPEKE